MHSQTTLLAEQCRLQEWASQIRDCRNRPDGMSVIEWCARNGLTKANYYYRLRRVREACLDALPEDAVPRAVIPVPMGLLAEAEENGHQGSITISAKGFSVHVTEDASASLLAEVLGVIRHVE